MEVGYARVSTEEQNEARQLNTFEERGITKVFIDKQSGKDTNRPQLKAVLDEDRKINAQKFDSAFYSNPDLRQVKAPQAQGISAEQLLSQLKESPELASALAQLLAGGKAG